MHCILLVQNAERISCGSPAFILVRHMSIMAMTVALWVAVLVALYTFGALGWIEFTGMFDQPETFLYSGVAHCWSSSRPYSV